jgi:hypothetical protein
MFCPNCKSEYRAGFTECSDCGAELVPKLEGESDPSGQDLALAWRGSDPSGFSAATAALQDAGISSYPINDHDQLAWGLGIPRPRYGILVHKSDLPMALTAVAPIQEGAPLAYAKEIWKSGAKVDESEELPSSEDQAPDDVAEEINPKNATLEVWSGAVLSAQKIQLCLRENGIGCVIKSEADVARVFVVPGSGPRAKEIIREVIEATPSD